ncbi:hypothetical protein PI124_g11968 [Phytophthora idaei]|nr:hypothetical protein PI125_g11748 [Phytophthora idaei]KAG3152488.1 hypothetical protein PI126_g10486 [Phytophthora idaei]KAG3243219.1 hypothetical protein PI124_g11968 [Phytophthora idaei]
MIKLFCALVGEGSAFSIIIEEWKTVALLKKAIADKLKYTGRADKLQLFLAKKDGGKWLDMAGTAAATLDEFGYPQGWRISRCFSRTL